MTIMIHRIVEAKIKTTRWPPTEHGDDDYMDQTLTLKDDTGHETAIVMYRGASEDHKRTDPIIERLVE